MRILDNNWYLETTTRTRHFSVFIWKTWHFRIDLKFIISFENNYFKKNGGPKSAMKSFGGNRMCVQGSDYVIKSMKQASSSWNKTFGIVIWRPCHFKFKVKLLISDKDFHCFEPMGFAHVRFFPFDFSKKSFKKLTCEKTRIS